jgi:hypothetical protein
MQETKDLVAVYLINGLIYIGEQVPLSNANDDGITITRPLAFAPGAQRGQMMLMEAFPFSDINAKFTIHKSSYIAVSQVTDIKAGQEYQTAISKIRASKSGLVLP